MVGLSENKANSARLELELGLSSVILAKRPRPTFYILNLDQPKLRLKADHYNGLTHPPTHYHQELLDRF